MPIVKLPNGQKVKFPDNMSSEQIQAVIEREMPDAIRPPAVGTPAPSPAQRAMQAPPGIEVELPDGTIVDVETDDPAVAAAAAHKYQQKNSRGIVPPTAPGAGKPAPLPPGFVVNKPVVPPMVPGGTVVPAPREMSLGDHAVEAASQFGTGVKALASGAIGGPVDLATGAANALSWGAERLANILPGEQGIRFPRVTDAVGGSRSVERAIDATAESVGVPLKDKDELDAVGRLAYEANKAAGAFLTPSLAARAVGMARAAVPDRVPTFTDFFTRPYESGSFRPVLGDVGAGAGAGTAVEAGRDALPDDWRGTWKGALSDFVLSTLGGAGGQTLTNLATAPVAGTRAVFNALAPDTNVPVSPAGLPFTRSMTEKFARFKQGQSDSPRVAAQNIKERAAETEAADMVPPTSGAMSGDVGLAAGEKAMRLSEPVPFQRYDQKVRSAAANKLTDDLPKTGDPEAAIEYADRYAVAKRETAQREADRAAGAATGLEMARQDKGATLRTYGDQKTAGDASTEMFNIFKNTMKDERAQKNALYDAPEIKSELISMDGLRKAASDVKALNTRAQGTDAVPDSLIEDILSYPKGAQIPFSEFQQFRPRLAKEYAAARAAEDKLKLDNLDKIRDAFSAGAADVANRPTPGGEAARAATENYKQYATKYVEGTGGDMKAAIARGDVTPSQEGYKFLTNDEAANQYTAMLGDAKDPQKGIDSARKLLLSQAAVSVDTKGRISAAAIRKWRDDNKAVLARIPGMKQEADEMVRAAVNGRDKENALANEIRAARKRLDDLGDDLRSGHVALLLGKAPEKAVAAVFGDKNPKKAMAAVVQTLGKNDDAKAGWRKAVTDYVNGRVRGGNANLTDGDNLPVQFDAMRKFFDDNAAALAEVFTPVEMNSARQVQKALGYAGSMARSAVPGSQTMENASLVQTKLFKALEIVYRFARGQVRGGGEMRGIKGSIEFSEGNIRDWPKELEMLFAFNPEVAHYVLTRPVREIGTPNWNKNLNRLMGLRAAGEGSVSEEAPDQRGVAGASRIAPTPP